MEKDFYDWDKRHAEILAIKGQLNPEIVLVGDSITHLWAGPPNEPAGNRGAKPWKELFGDKAVLNTGFGWDRTQNVLYRIQNGELDGLTPKLIVLHIGTNNLAKSKNAATNTPEEIAAAITLIVDKIHEKCPAAKVVLMGVFPRGQNNTDGNRPKIAAINSIISKAPATRAPWLTYLDITDKFLNPDGTISKEVMSDYLHPAEKGYAIWAEALKPYIP